MHMTVSSLSLQKDPSNSSAEYSRAPVCEETTQCWGKNGKSRQDNIWSKHRAWNIFVFQWIRTEKPSNSSKKVQKMFYLSTWVKLTLDYMLHWSTLQTLIKKSWKDQTLIMSCREPPREIPPMTRSCGRELLSKASELNGLPRLSRASTQKPESVWFTISWLSPTLLTLTGGYSWLPFSGEN